MTIVILQALLTAGGCYGLWRFCRALGGRGRTSVIISAGFIIRALVAQVLFWISWLSLPIGRPLQLGNGFWFFALDGGWYLGYAHDLLARGAKAILFIDTSYASRIFTQWFTVFAGAFGVVASTAILFNCFLYLATCALILRLASRSDERLRDFALASIALGPAAILWSLQLLKDTFFVFLIVATVVICSEWQRLWRGEVLRRWLSIAVCAAAMWYAVYALAGTRWYVGAIVAGGSLLFLGLVANLPRPRFAGSVVAVLLFLTLGQAFLLGGDLDVPPPVRAALDVRALFHPRAETRNAELVLTTARRGFQTTPGATMISPGPALVASAAPVVRPKPVEAAPQLPVQEKPAPVELLKPAETASAAPPPPSPAPQPAPPVAVPASIPVPVSTSPAPAPAPVLPAPAPVPVPAPVSPAPAPVPVPLPVTQTVAPVLVPSTVSAEKTAEPAPEPKRVAKAKPKRRHHVVTPAKPAPLPVTAPAPAKATVVIPKPVVAAPPPPAPFEPRQSLAEKIATGAAAMFVPRVVAQSAGLVRIGGGRGFWRFADFDTLVFDLVVFAALTLCVRGILRKKLRVTPLFLLVASLFAGLTLPMIYSVTNFGTLFRLREMIYVVAALMPLTLDLRTPAPAPDESR